MRVTIDLDRDIIIVPDNFFKKIAEENEKLEKYGAKAVKPLDRIKKSPVPLSPEEQQTLL